MIDAKFIEAIYELLYEERCVVVPGLGAFIVRETESSVNYFTKELTPIHSHLYFNKSIKKDDGVLANYIKNLYNISYSESLELIQHQVLSIFHLATEKKICNFQPLGNFFINADLEIFFISNSKLNFHASTFGLKPVKWNVEIKSKSAASTIVSETIEEPIHTKNTDTEEATIIEIPEIEATQQSLKRNSNSFWKIAANVALISMAIGILYLNSLSLRSVFNGESDSSLAASIPFISTPKEEVIQSDSNTTETSVKNPDSTVSTPAFIAVNGHLIPLQKNKPSVKVSDSNAVKNFEGYREHIIDSKGKYFVVGGAYMTEKMAQIECDQWNKLGYSATYFNIHKSSLIKVILNRFKNGKDASNFMVSVKSMPTNTISIQELSLVIK